MATVRNMADLPGRYPGTLPLETVANTCLERRFGIDVALDAAWASGGAADIASAEGCGPP